MIGEELNRLWGWQDRHKRVVGRLLLVLIATAAIDVVGTVLMYVFERHADKSEVSTLWDSFFFTSVQLLTVSSQLKNPVTTAGRVVDLVLEVWAVIVVAGSAGAIASFFQAGDAQTGDSP